MKYIMFLALLASCSWFRQDEDIEIKNPKPGTVLEIKEEALPK